MDMAASRKHALADKVESIKYHLEGLEDLVAALPEDGGRPAPDFQAAQLHAFGHWTLEMLGLGEVDTTEALPAARRILVAAMAGSGFEVPERVHPEPFEPDELDFVDLFADIEPGEDVEPDLTIEPIGPREQD